MEYVELNDNLTLESVEKKISSLTAFNFYYYRVNLVVLLYYLMMESSSENDVMMKDFYVEFMLYIVLIFMVPSLKLNYHKILSCLEFTLRFCSIVIYFYKVKHDTNYIIDYHIFSIFFSYILIYLRIKFEDKKQQFNVQLEV